MRVLTWTNKSKTTKALSYLSRAGGRAMQRLRILIVDDNNDFRKALRMFLNKQPGWKVVGEGTNGREAIDEAERLKPDLTIMDVNMPELNGIEAAREIKKAAPDCSILVLTEHNSVPLVCEALEAGVHAFLPKAEIRHLLATVRATIEPDLATRLGVR